MEVLEIVPELIKGLVELINEGIEFFELVNEIRELKNDLEFMKINLQSMDKLIKPQKLCLVEQILRDAAYDVEDFIEECKHLLEKPNSRIMEYATLVFGTKANWGKRRRSKEIKRKLSKLKEEMNFSLGLNRNLQHDHDQDQLVTIRDQSIIEYPTRADNDRVVGLESVSNEIKQLVFSEPNADLKVIGILGMPGVGKTTLARKMRKDMMNMGHFDCALFKEISSSSFDLKELLKNILEEVTGSREISTRGDDHELLEKLHEQLKGKKYLIILDNVWQISKKSWWNSLNSALPKEKNGSCVLITTRLKEVARSMGAPERHIYHHKTLSEYDSWLLFSKIVFSRDEGYKPPNRQLEAIAKEITAKCEGLPLAIKVIAGVMLGKEPSINIWRRVSQHFNEELNKKGELLDLALRMSYEEMPPHLKPCMLCFSIFPEDYEISMDEVVHLWASQRLIPKSEGRTTLEIGEEYFHQLIDQCLLLGERKDIFETRFQTCKLHGIVRAMVMKLANEKNFILLGDGGTMTFPCSPRVGFIIGSNYMDQFSKFNSKLRILVAREIPENREFISNVKSILGKQKYLRALDLSFDNEISGEEEDWLDDAINGSLSLLTCLKIENSRLKAVPKSVKKLKELQTLCLSQCYDCSELPPEMEHLTKLNHLDVSSCCDSLNYLPIQIERLSNLEILFGFKPSRIKGGCRMDSLKKWTQLRKLWIKIYSADQIEMRGLMVLSELKKLEVLVITLEVKSNIAALNAKLDCELPSPLENLNHLYLHGFLGVSIPRWLNPTSLPNLTHLHIYASNIKSFDPCFFGSGEDRWQLEALVLTNLKELEEEWPRLQTVMPCLRLLKVDECPNLRSLPCQVKNGLGYWAR